MSNDSIRMNAIRLKVLLSWLLFLACVVASSFHHILIAGFGYALILIVRFGLPHFKPSILIQRLCWILAGGIILFFALLLIHTYIPFPPLMVRIAEMMGGILLISILFPMFAYAVYSDYTLFKRSDLNEHP